jgi:hypothetical protein
MINNVRASDDAIRSLKEDELALVSGGLTIATYPVRAIRVGALTAYVSNGELVGVGLPDGTIKTP